MENEKILNKLFKVEYSKMVSVLAKLFGIHHIEVAEDLVSETFLAATETWKEKGIPDNPTAWLYAVAKNKAKDLFKRNDLFRDKVKENYKASLPEADSINEIAIDLSNKNIKDSQLQMMFAICDPIIPQEAQIGLSLRILCGFGIEEIANAFLSNKETINKRLFRAKEKLKTNQVKMEIPSSHQIDEHLDTVLKTIYLLFNEGYHSSSQNEVIRQSLCYEAMRLNILLIENDLTNRPFVNALMSLMCFHSSRLPARKNAEGELVLYNEQNKDLWNVDLIANGTFYMNRAAKGNVISKYHFEAAIAYWHTQNDSDEKWESILQYYNRLLQIEYSPIAALNRTYALSKSKGKKEAIAEALKLKLDKSPHYHSLLSYLYQPSDMDLAMAHLQIAFSYAKTAGDKTIIQNKILALKNNPTGS